MAKGDPGSRMDLGSLDPLAVDLDPEHRQIGRQSTEAAMAIEGGAGLVAIAEIDPDRVPIRAGPSA